ncbi:MAG: HIT domain-containing protein [Candidatus Babeliaceae bacterium]
MNHLYAPWRTNYVTQSEESSQSQQCPFCISPDQYDDEKNFIIKRFENAYVMLNKYPYNAGHLLIIPYAHKASLEFLSSQERAEIMEIMTTALQILQKVLKNQGTNIGINVGGKAAGGSVPDHLHWHAVPRFLGDTNFLPILAQTKSISLDLHDLYKKLKGAF